MTSLGVNRRRASVPGESLDPSQVAPRVPPSWSVRGAPADAGRPSLDALVEEIAGIRPLPTIAAQVLQIAEGERFSAHELALAISSDPALTSRILRVANSAYFGFPRRIATVRDAVVLLGFRQVRSTALAACALSALPGGGRLDPVPLWRHAAFVGLLAEMTAKVIHRHQDMAFTAGVLHNIGRIAFDQARPVEFDAARRLAAAERLTLHEAQRLIFGFSDAEVGGALALHWDFPADLALAVAHHATALDQLSDPESLAACIIRARQMATAYGVTDGVEAQAVTTDVASATASCTRLLEAGGGLEALLDRASAFVEHTVVRV